VLEIVVPDSEIVSRLSGRRVHPASGRVYHVVHNPPVKEGVDNETGEPLIQRDDDKEETVLHRLAVYHDQTEPLVDFYKSKMVDQTLYLSVEGVGPVEEISRKVLATVS